MSGRKIIRVFEFEKLYYDDKKLFKQKHWDALCKFQENTNTKTCKWIEYFRVLKNGVQFSNYVGVIQVKRLTIEILPKIDKDFSTAENDSIDNLDDNTGVQKQIWQTVLLQMLKECKLIKINQDNYADLKLRRNSILEIYFQMFLSEVERLQHGGLLKKYRKEEGNQTALKGQLMFAKNIAYNYTHQERFFVRYTDYNMNNVYNQILFQTLCLIPKLTSNANLSDRVGRLLLDFPQMNKCKISAETFDKLQFDRKTERYKEALLIAKMLLLNYRPDITGGSEDVIAILFDMNKLWEEFVYRRLKKEESNYKIEVSRQNSKNFWQSKRKTKTIRPDIVIETILDEPQTYVLDTKWKVIDDLVPADEDLKQMFTYNLYWQCAKSVLIYPSKTGDSNLGEYSAYEGSPANNNCAVATVCVITKENTIDKEIGRAVLEHSFDKAMLDTLRRIP